MAHDHDGSVSHWLALLKAGDEAAVGPLWDRYFDRLVRLAARKLCASRQPPIDEDGEDVALSAFQAFCDGVRQARFPRLNDREDLWRILVHLTACKAVDQIKRRGAERRGGGRVVLETDLKPDSGKTGGWSLDHVLGTEPGPDLAAQVADECEHQIHRLHDPVLRRIALMKLAGYTHEEIRLALGCSLRSVTLKLELIRKRWEESDLPP